MICKKCGNEITNEEKFCKNCGEMVQQVQENINEVGSMNVNNEENFTNANTESIANNSESVIMTNTDNIMNNNENIMNETNTLNNMTSIDNNLNNTNSNIDNNQNTGTMNTNNMNSAMPSNIENKKKSNLPLIIVFAVLGIIIVGLIVFIVINLIPKDNNSTNNNDNKPVVENQKPSTTNPENSNNTNKQEEVITVTNYDYQKVIGYDYALKNNKLYVKDNASNFITVLSNMSTLHSSVIAQKDNIKEKFITTGYTINNDYVKTVGSIQYLVYDVTYQGQNLILAYAKHQDGSTVVASVQVKSPYTYDEALEHVSKIIKASSKSKNTGSDTSSESFDVNISDIIE